MSNYSVRIPNGIMTFSKHDAVFNFQGEKVAMEFHRYCGPSFWINYGKEDETELSDWYEYPELVTQFEGWLHRSK